MNDTRTILRGQIYHINLDPNNKPIGSEMWPDRPGIIVSNDINNKYSNTVEVVYLTTKLKRKFSPTHVKISPANHPSLALCEQICTIDRSRLGELIDTASETDMASIDEAIAISLGLTGGSNHSIKIFHKWELYINKYQLQIGMELNNLFDDQFNKPTENVQHVSAANPNEIRRLEMQLCAMTKERDMHKTLYESSQKKLLATEEERDTYQRLYELATKTASDVNCTFL